MGLKRFILPVIIVGLMFWLISKFPEEALLIIAITIIILIGVDLIGWDSRQ